MTIKETVAELREKMEALQHRVAAKAAEFRTDERVPAEHRARIDSMQAQAGAVKERLPGEEGSAWDSIKEEVKRDMDALARDFEHTVSYIDNHYREQGK